MTCLNVHSCLLYQNVDQHCQHPDNSSSHLLNLQLVRLLQQQLKYNMKQMDQWDSLCTAQNYNYSEHFFKLIKVKVSLNLKRQLHRSEKSQNRCWSHSQRIKLGTSNTEGSALTNCATRHATRYLITLTFNSKQRSKNTVLKFQFNTSMA